MYNKKYLPRGIIPAIAKKLKLTKQAVYHRLKRNDEYTIDLLEQCLTEYLENKKTKSQRAKFKYDLILNQWKKFNGLP
ncbi:MAG: hypothetical protein CH6_2549 [Candidatus Kapaibacterium sp.]|nr:MAG: hypothetical protein CH6_2549 [Candidatus Kapabacteria bacterium]